MTLSITTFCHHAEYLCHYAECRDLFSIMLNPIILSVVMLNVNVQSVVMLNVNMQSIVMLNAIMLVVIMLNVVAHLKIPNCIN